LLDNRDHLLFYGIFIYDLNIDTAIPDKPLNDYIDESEELHKACQDYIDYVFSDEYNCDGVEYFELAVFQAALEAVFGEDVFEKHIIPEIERKNNARKPV
jgi:hypothetical protein